MADKYSVDKWLLYMMHMKYLFISSGSVTLRLCMTLTWCHWKVINGWFYLSFTPNQIERRLEKLGILNEVTKADNFSSYMKSNIRPHIAGTDMARLLLYYRILGDSSSGEVVSADTHRKLLTKLIPAAPGTTLPYSHHISSIDLFPINSLSYLHQVSTTELW